MGLDSALGSALSGLRVNQESLSVLSQNIANVNTDGYSRRYIEQVSVDIGGQGQGAEITAVKRQVDEFIVETVRDQGSSYAYRDTIRNYYDQMQLLFGTPGANNSLSTTLDGFFSSLQSLSNNPELNSLKLDAVTKGVDFANRLSSVTEELQQLRYQADKEINVTIKALNQELATLREVNASLDKTLTLKMETAPLLEKRDNLLKSIGEKINISTYYNPSGKVYITTTNGIGLLDDSQYELAYTPANTVDDFITDNSLQKLSVLRVDDTGQAKESAILVTSGQSSAVNSLIRNGRFRALLQMRDSDIPNILAQLDNIASSVRDNFNKIHNDGGGFPPAKSLVGTTRVTLAEQHNFNGSVRIGMVDSQGQPLDRQDGSALPPLTLRLEDLNNGYGVGGPDIQGIIDEINQYFYYDPVLDTASLGNLRDVKLVATSSTLGPVANGTFSFDLELHNESAQDSTITILGVTVNNGAAGLTSVLPGQYTLAAGERDRIGTAIDVDFAGGTGGPYTVSVQMRVVDGDGNISIGVMDYVIDDTPADNNVRNDRYVANAVSGDAALTASGTTQRFAEAMLVDSDGNRLSAGSSTAGFLKIVTLRDDYHILFDELDSQELGSSQDATLPITNKGFSHFFGLNNFFVDNDETGSAPNALNFSVRSDITENPNLISAGELQRSPAAVVSRTIGLTQAAGTLQFSTNVSIGDSFVVQGVTFNFVAAAAADDQITVGATLPATLANIVAKLNALNSTTIGSVDAATYADDGIDTVTVTAVNAGTFGNSYTFNFNNATAGVSISGSASSVTANGSLSGGRDQVVSRTEQPATYEIGQSANQIIERLSLLSSSILSFSSAGSLPDSSNSLSGYMADIVSFAAGKTKDARNNADKEKLFLDGFVSKLESGSGVNLDEELAATIIFQNAYTASARVINVTKELFDVLMQTVQS
jgi:flagellar hook-associated protein 1 FlgK